MRKYSDKISLAQTARGVWGLDTVKGCRYGMAQNSRGCYGCCYAYSIASRYGYDFSDSVIRGFKSKNHIKSILKKLESIDMDFVRIGITGDPSECWEHTIDVCKKIKPAGKKVVIITKHWIKMPRKLYKKAEKLGLIINTSVSALDGAFIEHRLNEYRKLKNVCNSVLRIVSCDFNLKNERGRMLNHIQEYLFDKGNVIDTVLRLSNSHRLVLSGVVNTEKQTFLSSQTNASIKNKDSFFGYCQDCPDMCGLTIGPPVSITSQSLTSK